jgi:two-component system phosphate regulon response regulator OmpR
MTHMTNRLLLIDGDRERATAVSDQLELLGYTVQRSACGTAGHSLALTGGFDCILLDLNVSGRDALLICESLRAQYQTTPVIVLATKLSDHTMQTALDAGADAVLPHAHPATLLAAWIRALLRRHVWMEGVYFRSHRLIKIGDLLINIEQRTVARDGEPIELTDLEFSVLLALARSAGMVLERGELINQVWGARAREVYDDAVNAQIKRIRRKLERNPSQPAYIRTAFGHGYVLAKPDALSRSSQRSPSQNGRSKPAPPPKADND